MIYLGLDYRHYKPWNLLQGTAQHSHFNLIIWYAEKIIPTLKELSLCSIRSSSNYFDGNINLVHSPKGGIKYCNIYLNYPPCL